RLLIEVGGNSRGPRESLEDWGLEGSANCGTQVGAGGEPHRGPRRWRTRIRNLSDCSPARPRRRPGARLVSPDAPYPNRRTRNKEPTPGARLDRHVSGKRGPHVVRSEPFRYTSARGRARREDLEW